MPNSTITSERTLPVANHETQALHQEVRTLIDVVKSEMGGMRTELAGMRTELGGVRTELAGVKVEVAGVKGGLHAIAGQVASLSVELGAHANQVQQGFAGLAHQNQQIIHVLQQIYDNSQQLLTLLIPRLAS